MAIGAANNAKCAKWKAKPNKSHEKKEMHCIAISLWLVQFVHCYCSRLETVCISVWVQRLIIDDINHCALSRSVVDMSSVLVPPTTDSGLPTTTTTPTPRVVSINPCRRQGAAAALPAVCTALVNSVCGFHCGYLSWMCPCLTIYRSLRMYWVCVRGGLYCQSVYLSICLFVWLPGCRVYRIVFALQIHRHEKCSFVHLYWFFLLSPQLNTNYLHALAIWEFIEQIFRYERVSFMIMGRRQAAKCDDTEIQVQMYLYLSLSAFICVYVVTVS